MTQWKNGMLGEIEDDDGNNLAVVNLSAPDALRNLAMMTAAPELLEAVKAYQKAVNAGFTADPELWADASRKTEAAIARVEGRK